jgi:hypothetical protein
MLPEIRSALSAERACDLQAAGSRERMARAAAGARPGGSRRRLGRGLMSLGSRIAGEGALFEELYSRH